MADEMSPIDAIEATTRLQERHGSPHSLSVEFIWPLPEEEWTELSPEFTGTREQARDWLETAMQKRASEIGSSLVDQSAPSLDEGETVEASSIQFGIGASGEAIALIVMGALGVIANLDGTISFFHRVRDWYRNLSGATLPSGSQLRRPSLSLGAAVALAGADLSDRLSDIQGIRVVSAVVHPGLDINHSGCDLFTIVFGNDNNTWVYLVDSGGRVLSFSGGLPLPFYGQMYWGVGGGIDDDSYPMLGDPG